MLSNCLTLALIPMVVCLAPPPLGTKFYQQKGDISLAGLFPLSMFSAKYPCGPGLASTGISQYVEAFVFAINQINDRWDILPRVRLGFSVLDTCRKANTALAQMLHLRLPDWVNASAFPQSPAHNSSGEVCEASRDDSVVVGLVGAMRSSASIAVAKLAASYQLPQISYFSTSDSLSDRENFPYFLRVIPPDRFQIDAIAALIQFYRWSYVAFLHDDDAYGYGGLKNFEQHLTKDLCLAFSKATNYLTTNDQYDDIVAELMRHDQLHVVVLFCSPYVIRPLIRALRRSNSARRFVWIGGEGLVDPIQKSNSDPILRGLFSFQVAASYDVDFEDHYLSLNPTNNAKNPWFRELWQLHFDCSFERNATQPCNLRARFNAENGYTFRRMTGLVSLSVNMFAMSLHNLINTRCPNASGAAIAHCLDGETLLASLKSTRLQESDGSEIRFSDDGEIIGRYLIKQIQLNSMGEMEEVEVGRWYGNNSEISLNTNKTVKWYKETNDGSVPASVCSTICGLHEVTVPSEVACCWNCRRCRSNEIVIENATDCRVCAALTWPEQMAYEHCIAIPYTSLQLRQPLGITLASLSLLGVLLTCAVAAFYVKHDTNALIKASGRELSYTMLVGVTAAYCSAFLLLTRPAYNTCMAVNFGFPISFASIYSALLVRTVTIFRIFRLSTLKKTLPPCVTRQGQMLLTVGLVSVQVTISVIATILDPPDVTPIMPQPTQKLVEFNCNLSHSALIGCLIFVGLVVFTCTIYAFKTRKLPDNFNESRFITICAYSILVIWLAFITSYFATAQGYFRNVMLCVALLLNGAVVLTSLFVPRIYAMMCVCEDQLHIRKLTPGGAGTFQTEVSAIAGHASGSRWHNRTHAEADC